MKKVLNRVGQSTMEYVIVLTAIVAAILFAATQFIRPSMNKVMRDASVSMNASGSLLQTAGGNVVGYVGTTTGGSTITP